MTKKSNSGATVMPVSQISQLVGASSPVLPGESESIYKNGLHATITELGAVTPLQIYLAEKIFDCLWWIRRYESFKRASVVRAMGDMLKADRLETRISKTTSHITQALLDGNLEDPVVVKAMEHHNYTIEILTQEAMSKRREQISKVDEQTALRIKTLNGLQSSYEALVNRKVHIERLQLQNNLLRRDLEAIEVEAVSHDKPTKASGKPA